MLITFVLILQVCKAGSTSVGPKGDVADKRPVLRVGRAIALALAGEGMNLKLAGRSTDKLQKVRMCGASIQPGQGAQPQSHLRTPCTMPTCCCHLQGCSD